MKSRIDSLVIIAKKRGGPFSIDLMTIDLPPERLPTDQKNKLLFENTDRATISNTINSKGNILISQLYIGEQLGERFINTVVPPNGKKSRDWVKYGIIVRGSLRGYRSHGGECRFTTGEIELKTSLIIKSDLNNPIIFRADSEMNWVWIKGSGKVIVNGEVIKLPFVELISNDLKILNKMVSSNKWKDRANAAWALGELQDDRSINCLKKLLKDENWYVKRFAIQALGDIGNKSVYKDILPLLKDKDREVRRIAASSLGELSERKAIEPLVELLKDSDRWVVGNAAKAIEIIEPGRAKDILYECLQLISDKKESKYNDINSEYAIVVSAEINSEKALELILDWFQQKDIKFPLASIEALETFKDKRCILPLIKYMNSQYEYDIKNRIAEALGTFEGHDAMNALLNNLKYHNSKVRIKSAIVLISKEWKPNEMNITLK